MCREKAVPNCGYEEMWNGYEMLVAKVEGKLSEDSGIYLAI
jgi:hypothetical protein